MFVFSLDNGLPSGSRTVWSRLSLQPLAAGPLTPFSYSVLEEVAGRAWYQYYDELGFEPTPRARVIRQIGGYPYLNLTLSAERDAENAGIEPTILLVNDERFPITSYEKPGFLAGFKTGRNRKKIESTLALYSNELPAITKKAEAWAAKTKELRWTQADILQIMEEIERISSESFKLFFAARHNLEWIYNRLFWLTIDQQPYPTNLALMGNISCDLTKLHEYVMAEQLLDVGALCKEQPEVVQWLEQETFAHWESALPRDVAEAIGAFVARYGHRCANEGEIRNPRWHDDMDKFLTGLQAYIDWTPKHPAHLPASQPLHRLLETIDGKAKNEAQQMITQLRRLLQLQSNALHAFAHILTGTRRWALAAAKEAMADGRLQQEDDVFFFALEEMKQMMTGEWNVSASQEIQATCEKRRTEYTTWQAEKPAWLSIGDSPATAVGEHGLPGVTGHATGPLRRRPNPTPHACDGAIVGTDLLTSGWAPILPFARALIAAEGTPLDPLVAAARSWHVPTVVGLGATFDTLTEGAQTSVSGDSGIVEQ